MGLIECASVLCTFEDLLIKDVDPFRDNNSQCSPTEQPGSQHSDQLQLLLRKQRHQHGQSH